MFCEECGTKNKEEALFCENCGHKFKKQSVKVKVPTQKMSKSTKICGGVIIVVLVVLIGICSYMSNMTKPEKVALKYFKALASKDAEELYDTMNLEKSDFVSEKMLKECLKNEEKVDITNYKVEKYDTTNQNANALSKSVKIVYIDGKTTKEKSKIIRLVKNKKNKYLFFDNWMVDSSELVVKDYKLSVPANAKVSMNGVELSKEYKKESTSYSDVYVIPTVLKGKYNLSLTFENGMKFSNELSVNSSYGTVGTYNLKLDEKLEKELKNDVTNKVKTLYQSAIDSKSFEDIKSSFEKDDQEHIEQAYNSLKNMVTSENNKLKSFEIVSSELKLSSVTEDTIRMNVELKCNYIVSYKNGSETKEFAKKNDKRTLQITYTMKENEYTISNISLNSYFSHYNY